MTELRYRKGEKITRERYMVSYSFATSNSCFAQLRLTYIIDCSEEQIIEDMESEFKIWFEHYPVLLMVSAFNQFGELIHLCQKGDYPHLIGFLNGNKKCVSGWQLYHDNDIPNCSKSAGYQEKIYKKIPFESADDLKTRINKEYRIRAIVAKWLFTYLWTFIFLIIPLAWFIGGLFYGTIALLSTIWTFCVLGIKLAKRIGWLKESAIAKQNQEKHAKMEHYFYHCERNPTGFERLRKENGERDEKERIKKEFQKLSKNTTLKEV